MIRKEKINPDINEEEFNDIIKELKSLPDIPLPQDFESKLRNRIALSNQKKSSSNLAFGNYYKYLVYGGSFIVVVCIVLFFVFIFNGTHNIDQFKGTIDSTEYQGKKIIIIPPTETTVEGTSKKPIEKITSKKDYKSKEKLEEYFENKPKESLDKSNQIAPAIKIFSAPGTEKTFIVDTLKKDSIKNKKNKK
jgi:hypothetical protein